VFFVPVSVVVLDGVGAGTRVGVFFVGFVGMFFIRLVAVFFVRACWLYSLAYSSLDSLVFFVRLVGMLVVLVGVFFVPVGVFFVRLVGVFVG